MKYLSPDLRFGDFVSSERHVEKVTYGVRNHLQQVLREQQVCEGQEAVKLGGKLL